MNKLAVMQVVPILRAGLVLIENIATVLPAQVTYHVGLVRNEETLQVCPCIHNIKPPWHGDGHTCTCHQVNNEVLLT